MLGARFVGLALGLRARARSTHKHATRTHTPRRLFLAHVAQMSSLLEQVLALPGSGHRRGHPPPGGRARSRSPRRVPGPAPTPGRWAEGRLPAGRAAFPIDLDPDPLTLEGARVEIRALWVRVQDLEGQVEALLDLIAEVRFEIQRHG